MKIKFTILLLLCFLSSFSQTPTLNLIEKPEMRVRKITFFNCYDFEIPDIINDSTAILYREEYFFYNQNQLSKKETITYNHQGQSEKVIDTIIYIKNDSVIIKKSNSYNKESLRLMDFLDIFMNLKRNGKMQFYSQDHDATLHISVRNGLVRRMEYNYINDKLKYDTKYDYDKLDRINRITEIRKSYEKREKGKEEYVKSQNSRHFDYSKNNYTVNWSSGEVWYGSDSYYFNNNGYLIKTIRESDTQPSIIIYEYEKGIGNVMSFEYQLRKIMFLNPIIY